MYYLLPTKQNKKNTTINKKTQTLVIPEKARKWVLRVTPTKTDGWERLRLLVRIMAKQKCSEVTCDNKRIISS